MGTFRLIVVGALVLFGSVAATGQVAAATPAPAVITTPCLPGTPVASDFDGDARADLVVTGRLGVGGASTLEHLVVPGDGSAPAWLVDTGDLVSADLNGDVCADAIEFLGGEEPWLKVVPGTVDGLDAAQASTLTIPQASDVGAGTGRMLFVKAAGLRHHGISQVVVAGRHSVADGDDYDGFVDVLTLDAALAVSRTQVIPVAGSDSSISGFGQSLATSGGTVAVGAPYARVRGHNGAGAVRLYTPDAGEPSRLVQRLVLTQNSPGVPGTAEAGDHFGAALAMRGGRLAIGAPGESDGRIRNAGLVQPIRWNEANGSYSAPRAISQNTAGVPGSNETGDYFGSHLAIGRGLTANGSWDIVIGAAEAHGKLKYAGAVTVANFTAARYRGYTQATRGVPGTREAWDLFGAVGVSVGSSGVDTVLIGAPGEDHGRVTDVGYAIRSDGKRLGTSTTWTAIPIPADAPAGMTEWGLGF